MTTAVDEFLNKIASHSFTEEQWHDVVSALYRNAFEDGVKYQIRFISKSNKRRNTTKSAREKKEWEDIMSSLDDTFYLNREYMRNIRNKNHTKLKKWRNAHVRHY